MSKTIYTADKYDRMSLPEAQRPTCRVRFHGSMCRAFADKGGRVWVYDSVAGHYTTCHSLTAAQLRYVRARTR